MNRSVVHVFIGCAFLLISVFRGYAQENLLQQHVSINLKDTALDVVFDELSKQCECYFSYNANIIEGESKVSINVQNASISSVLDSLFHNEFSLEGFKNQIIIFDNADNPPLSLASVDSNIHISGKVIDNISGLPIPYASVGLIGTYLGTVCNENGAFALKIPYGYKNNKITISSMGYGSYSIPTLDPFVEVRLEPVTISLQEVLVRSVGALVLLRKARKNFNNNYQKEAYSYTSFYRESTKRGDKYLSYTEAYLAGKKYGLHSGRDDKLVLLKSRLFKITDPVDTILVKLQGGIDACIRLDLIRNQPDFISSDSEKLYDYQVRDLRVWNDKLVHVLAFSPKSGIMDALFEGELYIAVDDIAIIGASFGYSPQRMSVIKKSLVLRKSNKVKAKAISTKYSVKYTQYEGKYYVNHLRGEMDLKAKRRKQVRFANFHTSLEMVVTRIDTVNVENPQRKDLVKTLSIFSDQVSPTPDSFWEKDNIIIPEPNIIKAFQYSGFKLEEKDSSLKY